jgi:dTDP-4-dehydrorhamnose reductase
MRIAVTGASGLLGSYLVTLGAQRGHELRELRRAEFDLLAPEVSRLDGTTDVIIHCAAETNVDLCETDPAHAYACNAVSTEILAKWCTSLDIKLVYIGSCGVFSGSSKEPYCETDPPQPRTVYARSKYAGETATLCASRRNLVCRVGWMYGGTPTMKKNFVEARRREAVNKGTLESATDKIGTPTFAGDAAARIIDLVTTNCTDVVHIANTGIASRHQYVSEIISSLEINVEVLPVDSSKFPRPAPVPDNEALVSTRLEELGLEKLREWKTALRDYVTRNYTA